jgi:predicted transcriptional regulator
MRTIKLKLPVRDTMRTINLELSDGLYERVRELATKNKVSINLLVATALADTILMPGTEKCFAERNQ